MARKWLNLFAGATLSFAVAGNALADEGKITVFAAASLTNAMQDIATQFKKEKGVDVVSSFASSSTLARQIEAGAPADLFISADQKWMDYAVDKKAIDTATRQTLLGNSLVVVAPETPKIAVMPLAGSVSLIVRQWLPNVWEKFSSSMISAPPVHG
jgi:molybdate transport system substrate-binding protein